MVSNTTTLERVCVIVVEWGKRKDKGGSSQEHKVIKQALTRYVSLCTEGERLVNISNGGYWASTAEAEGDR